MRAENAPYIDAEMRALLEPIWKEAAPDLDWYGMSEADVIAMREPVTIAVNEALRQAPDLPRVVDLTAQGAFGQTRVRLYDPLGIDQPVPALLFLHGGGWVGGSIESRDDGCRRLAHASKLLVLSVDYVLAPEHKFPDPLDDVVTVCRWLHKHGRKYGIDTDHLAIGGDSAGANLALAATLDLRGTGEDLIRQMFLLYGVFAHDHSTASHRRFGQDGRYTLSSAAMDCCWRMYLADSTQDQDPRAAPLLADLSGLPPTYIICGSLDPLLDDSQQLHERLTEAGVNSELRIYDGVTHSFLSFTDDVSISRQGWNDLARHVASRMPSGTPLRAPADKGKLLLKTRGDLETICRIVSDAINVDLPTEPNTSSRADHTALWLGPQKWLVVVEPSALAETKRELASALSSVTCLVSDASDAYCVLEVGGSSARELLAKVCALDLHADKFGPGDCAQSLLVRIPMLLHQVDATPTYHVYVDRSFSSYAWDWLSDAASEFIGRSPA